MKLLRARDNPRVRRWRRLMDDARERRRERRAILEGPHLLAAYLDSGGVPEALLVSETGAQRAEIAALAKRAGVAPTALADGVFRSIADTETPAGIAAEIALPDAKPALADAPSCVFLERIQDAGNVGAILRSAAALGLRDVVLGAGCADPWSQKVLRAAAGAHFSLRISAAADLVAALARFGGKAVCTVPRGGTPLAEADLSGRVGWIFGAEGQGVSGRLAARAALKVTIPMPGGAESLNVAVAAAICFYEMLRQLNIRGARS
ncbi:MAG: TrmH family RNA methyltransferase [Burkholderiales bacterium]